jgi:hypothetical protein
MRNSGRFSAFLDTVAYLIIFIAVYEDMRSSLVPLPSRIWYGARRTCGYLEKTAHRGAEACERQYRRTLPGYHWRGSPDR